MRYDGEPGSLPNDSLGMLTVSSAFSSQAASPKEGRLCFAIIGRSRSITTGRRSWSLSRSWSRSFLSIQMKCESV